MLARFILYDAVRVDESYLQQNARRTESNTRRHTIYAPFTLLVTRLYMLPSCGPSKAKIAITTIATKTRINAYSTNPWPSSCGTYNKILTSFHLGIGMLVNPFLDPKVMS